MTSLLFTRQFDLEVPECPEQVTVHLICSYTSLLPCPPPGQAVSITAPYPPIHPYQSSSSKDTEKKKSTNNLSRADVETNQHHVQLEAWLSIAINRFTCAWRQNQRMQQDLKRMQLETLNETYKIKLEKLQQITSPLSTGTWWNTDFVKNHVAFDQCITSSNQNDFLVGRPQEKSGIMIKWAEWEASLCTIQLTLDDWPNSANEFVYLSIPPWIDEQTISNDIPSASKSFSSIFHNPHLNLNVKPLILNLNENTTLYIPPMSGFCISSMEDWSRCNLKQLGTAIGGWDMIVIDPPWPNKSNSRSGSYRSIDIYDLFKFPLPVSNTTTRTLVCVWVTNKVKFRRFVLTKLFPSWGVRNNTVSEWYWVKITAHDSSIKNNDTTDPQQSGGGEPVWPLSSKHRRCYEGLITGYWAPDECTPINPLPRTVFLSTPLHHSRKPILTDLVRPYLEKNRSTQRCGLNMLELFARGISGGSNRDDFTMVVGNEAVAFNQINRPH